MTTDKEEDRIYPDIDWGYIPPVLPSCRIILFIEAEIKIHQDIASTEKPIIFVQTNLFT